MQNEQLIRETETANVAVPTRRASSFFHLAEVCECRRTIRIRVPLPRRSSCLTKRALIAALREAEQAQWQDSGGDFLRSASSK